MTPEELIAKTQLMLEQSEALKEYYAVLFPEPEFMLSTAQFGRWIRQYGFDFAAPALDATAQKMSMVNQMLEEHPGLREEDGNPVEPFGKKNIVLYASKIMSETSKAMKGGDLA